jgi:hypothetical protein
MIEIYAGNTGIISKRIRAGVFTNILSDENIVKSLPACLVYIELTAAVGDTSVSGSNMTGFTRERICEISKTFGDC